jgi:hypothetical protein
MALEIVRICGIFPMVRLRVGSFTQHPRSDIPYPYLPPPSIQDIWLEGDT